MSYVSTSTEVEVDVNLDVLCSVCYGDLEADISGDDLSVEPCKKCSCTSVDIGGDDLYQIIEKGINTIINNPDYMVVHLIELKTKVETYRILNK